jgi:hypothetical protein
MTKRKDKWEFFECGPDYVWYYGKKQVGRISLRIEEPDAEFLCSLWNKQQNCYKILGKVDSLQKAKEYMESFTFQKATTIVDLG